MQSYDVLVRTAEGLCIPRERMGLSFWGPDGTWYSPPDAYPEGVTLAHTPKEVTSALLRRHLIAFGGIVTAGTPVAKLGELLDDLGTLPPVPLTSQLSHRDVVRVRDITRRLAEAGNGCLCDPQTLSDAAARVTQLLDVPGTAQVKRSLMVAVAELRIEAGWAALDAGLYRHALYHFARALELAPEARDAFCQATALRYAGVASAEHGHPDDGLKMLQSAQVAAWKIPSGEERAVIVGETGRAAVETPGSLTRRPPSPCSASLRPRARGSRRAGSCGDLPAPIPSATWTVPRPSWRSSAGAWTSPSSWQWRRCAVGRQAA